MTLPIVTGSRFLYRKEDQVRSTKSAGSFPMPCLNVPGAKILINLNVANQTKTDTAGTLEKGLERAPLRVEHNRFLPLLDLTFGEVSVNPSNVNPTSGGTFQAVGGVPGRSADYNWEAKRLPG
jgi:hypothetical protein